MEIRGCDFDEVCVVDFEFLAQDGDRPTPVCLVARELGSARETRLWLDELGDLSGPPYRVDARCLFVSYFAPAELGCHLVLGWPIPENVVDLFAEFRAATNGNKTPCGRGLLGALAYFGLDAMSGTEKDRMRDLVLRGGPWSNEERAAILDYCASDVEATARLLYAIEPQLDLPRALLRGRYMKAVAHMGHVGIPIDMDSHRILRTSWDSIKRHLIERIDSAFGVFEGLTFKHDRFDHYLAARGISWPRHTDTGALKLDGGTFKDRALIHPELEPLRQLRKSLSELRLEGLVIGSDDRNRCALWPFKTWTGRNAPSNTEFIFGPAKWVRGLIRPPLDSGLIYADFEQQEFGTGAALSGDLAMQAAYRSGDPYLEFAKQAGAAPRDATKASHGAVREQFKTCALGVQYGMQAQSLAHRIGQPEPMAKELLRLHHETYPRYWRWSDAALDYALLRGRLFTAFGWMMRLGTDTDDEEINPRRLRNAPIQGNGAEITRLAAALVVERGVRLCATIHDALLAEAPLPELEAASDVVRDAMAEASRIVLRGFELRSEVKLIRYPDRYMDDKGREMWEAVWSVVRELTVANA